MTETRRSGSSVGAVDLAALRATAEAATPGPWHALGSSVGSEVDGCTCGGGVGTLPHEYGCGLEGPLAQTGEVDARHIAAFDPPTVLALLDRLEAARALADEWERHPYALVSGNPVSRLRAVLDGAA